MGFETRYKTLQGVILAKSPGDASDLYKIFARLQKMVVDVYTNARSKPRPFCHETYGMRYIDSISLKFPEQKVYYIDNVTDMTTFGVSTAAVWQRRGTGTTQYWTCFGNVDYRDNKGGLMACVKHYNIWITFGNLKVKEPLC
ncbi:uncharacterized protein LOC142976900 [Anticarsia gemmatalis]|uniref:uncharacterized protein LOC142976900 n=1 Tax=Anticarsia gemmatalis TaxID=129554 RepID=UPI003F77757A